MLHEVLEAYIGGEKTPNSVAAISTNTDEENANYFTAHDEAVKIDSRKKDDPELVNRDRKLYIKYDGKEKLINDLKK